MPKGVSIHIGVSRVNPRYYEDWYGNLYACEYDAEEMRKIAQSMNYESSTLILNEDATISHIKEEIKAVADELKEGDIFFLSYSGHGAPVPDINQDERSEDPTDTMDEAWVLYDGMLIDDELYALWAKFDAGVRIVIVCDSCHSESSAAIFSKRRAEFLMESQLLTNKATEHILVDPNWRPKSMDIEIFDKVYRKNRAYYDEVQNRYRRRDKIPLNSELILLTACRDDQLAVEGNLFGLFTECLISIWDNGKFLGNYYEFYNNIKIAMAKRISPQDQEPQISSPRQMRATFSIKKQPFSI